MKSSQVSLMGLMQQWARQVPAPKNDDENETPIEIGVPRCVVELFLHRTLPAVNELVVLFSKAVGCGSLPPKLKAELERRHVEGWAQAYEGLLGFAFSIVLLEAQEIPLESCTALTTIETEDDLQQLIASFWDACYQYLLNDAEDIPAYMKEAPSAELFSAPSLFLNITLAMVFNYFSCMVHRQTLFHLVRLAKEGSDQALFKAIQIDKTCLTDIAWFRERQMRAADEGDVDFLVKLAHYKKKPMFQSGTALNSLYLVFCLLDALGLLDDFAKDMPRFADLCQQLGVYGPEDDVADAASFGKVYYRFRRQYSSPIQRTAHRLVLRVKDTV